MESVNTSVKQPPEPKEQHVPQAAPAESPAASVTPAEGGAKAPEKASSAAQAARQDTAVQPAAPITAIQEKRSPKNISKKPIFAIVVSVVSFGALCAIALYAYSRSN